MTNKDAYAFIRICQAGYAMLDLLQRRTGTWLLASEPAKKCHSAPAFGVKLRVHTFGGGFRDFLKSKYSYITTIPNGILIGRGLNPRPNQEETAQMGTPVWVFQQFLHGEPRSIVVVAGYPST